MFDKILIANRGEIACRIIRTCQKMGVRTVAVHSDADAAAKHVHLADEACRIGEAAPSKSYLLIENILEAAKKHGAQAIHPGYGFLSENAEFARKCIEAGIVFIGPSAEAMEKMGAKDQAKILMEKADVPIVPGYHGTNQDFEFLKSEAEKIGYPLMIKAVLGGGGKGMRVVANKDDFSEALESARNEARNAFGDDQVLLEHFVSGPRHIEFQIFGDQHGNVVHLNERECSLQRRHQKIIEESPSPFLDEDLRNKMANAAVGAAKAVDYVGAGTIEFIVGDDRGFYFMEMNTRLQVEHPVTEMITGLDLVEWQLKVAADETLPLKQNEIRFKGHAIEARLYSENPETGFLPDIGKLHRLSFPTENIESITKTRIDTGVDQGDEISIHYDPMIAKIIVHSDTRKNAITAMKNALSHTGIIGVSNNLGFLQAIVHHPQFEKGTTNTLFVDAQLDNLLLQIKEQEVWVGWGTAISCLLKDFEIAENVANISNDTNSPWNLLNNWRMGNSEPHRVYLKNTNGDEIEIQLKRTGDTFEILNSEKNVSVTACKHGSIFDLNWENPSTEKPEHHLMVLHHQDQRLAVYEKGQSLFTQMNPLAYEQGEEEKDFRLAAPMPGNVIRVLVENGAVVSLGQPLLVMEAMKMEHSIVAPADGIVEKVLFKPGDLVQSDDKLVEFSVA